MTDKRVAFLTELAELLQKHDVTIHATADREVWFQVAGSWVRTDCEDMTADEAQGYAGELADMLEEQ